MMDFDKLSVKEQLELRIYGIEKFITEDTILIQYFENYLKEVEGYIEYDEKIKPKVYPSPWRTTLHSFKIVHEFMVNRMNDYKESIYKLKDQLYNLKENENLVSSE